MKKVLTFAAILALAALSLSADIYVKSKSHTDAMSIMGQNTPAKDDVTEQWISENALAQIGAAQGFIIDLKKNTMTSSTTATRPTSRRPCRWIWPRSCRPRWRPWPA